MSQNHYKIMGGMGYINPALQPNSSEDSRVTSMFEPQFVTLSIQHANEMTDKVRDKVDIIVGEKLGDQARDTLGDKVRTKTLVHTAVRHSGRQLGENWKVSGRQGGK